MNSCATVSAAKVAVNAGTSEAKVTVAKLNQRMNFSPNRSETAPPTSLSMIMTMPGAATMNPWPEREKPWSMA